MASPTVQRVSIEYDERQAKRDQTMRSIADLLGNIASSLDRLVKLEEAKAKKS